MTKKIKLKIKQNEQKIEELKREIKEEKFLKKLKIFCAFSILIFTLFYIFSKTNVFDFLAELIIFFA